MHAFLGMLPFYYIFTIRLGYPVFILEQLKEGDHGPDENQEGDHGPDENQERDQGLGKKTIMYDIACTLQKHLQVIMFY